MSASHANTTLPSMANSALLPPPEMSTNCNIVVRIGLRLKRRADSWRQRSTIAAGHATAPVSGRLVLAGSFRW